MSTAKSLLTFLIVAAAACFPAVPESHGTTPGGDNQQTEVRLLFAGDILLSRGVEHQLIHNPQALSRALFPILSGADLAVGNLEGAVASQEGCIQSTRQAPCFPIREDL